MRSLEGSSDETLYARIFKRYFINPATRTVRQGQIKAAMSTQDSFVLVTDPKPRARRTSVKIQSRINHK